jgi:hypothetical protein
LGEPIAFVADGFAAATKTDPRCSVDRGVAPAIIAMSFRHSIERCPLSSRKLLTGNEALALGALHAGARVIAGYPGTPSTGAIESLLASHPPDVHVEWSTNEKVALEVAAAPEEQHTLALPSLSAGRHSTSVALEQTGL